MAYLLPSGEKQACGPLKFITGPIDCREGTEKPDGVNKNDINILVLSLCDTTHQSRPLACLQAVRQPMLIRSLVAKFPVQSGWFFNMTEPLPLSCVISTRL